MPYEFPDSHHDGPGDGGEYVFLLVQDRFVLVERTEIEDETVFIDGIDESETPRRILTDSNGKIITTKRRATLTGTVSSTPVPVDLSGYEPPYSVGLQVGSGNTSRWEYSFTPGAAQTPGSAKWWPGSLVDLTASAESSLLSAVQAVRFTRVSGSSTDTYEINI